MRSQPHRYVQYTAIHQLILCGTDISSVKAKIALAKVNWAPRVEPGKALACYTNCNTPKKKPNKSNSSWGTTNETFTFISSEGKAFWEGRRLRIGGLENKNHTTAFQVMQKEVPKQAGFLPGCSTSPQFLKLSNSTKTWSILSYRGYKLALCIQPIHPSWRKNTETQILSSSLDGSEEKKKEL